MRMQEADFYREGILNLCQDGTDTLMCSGIVLKKKNNTPMK
jgi:hypothetical protein